MIQARIGFNSDCLCLDCLYEFVADFRDEVANPYRSADATHWWKQLNAIHTLSDRIKNLLSSLFHLQPPSVEEKDKRQFPKCNSANVKTVFELIGQPCPICKKGVIEEIKTGQYVSNKPGSHGVEDYLNLWKEILGKER